MSDPRGEQIGRDGLQQVIDWVGHPRVCKVVDSGTRSAVSSLLRSAGAPSGPAGQLGSYAGNEVKQVCTAMSTEGRAVLVLVGATAATIYGVLHIDELKDDVKDAIRSAQIPLTVPLDRIGVAGQLKLKLSLEEAEANYRLETGRGDFRMRMQHNFDSNRTGIGATYTQPLWGGTLSARANHEFGGNTDSNTSVLFQYSIKF